MLILLVLCALIFSLQEARAAAAPTLDYDFETFDIDVPGRPASWRFRWTSTTPARCDNI